MNVRVHAHRMLSVCVAALYRNKRFDIFRVSHHTLCHTTDSLVRNANEALLRTRTYEYEERRRPAGLGRLAPRTAVVIAWIDRVAIAASPRGPTQWRRQ